LLFILIIFFLIFLKIINKLLAKLVAKMIKYTKFEKLSNKMRKFYSLAEKFAENIKDR